MRVVRFVQWLMALDERSAIFLTGFAGGSIGTGMTIFIGLWLQR